MKTAASTNGSNQRRCVLDKVIWIPFAVAAGRQPIPQAVSGQRTHLASSAIRFQ
jgi:hypothetical protein